MKYLKEGIVGAVLGGLFHWLYMPGSTLQQNIIVAVAFGAVVIIAPMIASKIPM